MPRIVVNVTQERIERGKKVNCARCPVALALREDFGADARDFRVHSDEVEWERKGVFHYVPLPKEAQEFIKRFDLSAAARKRYYGSPDPPAPFSFELDLPFPPPKGAWTE